MLQNDEAPNTAKSVDQRMSATHIDVATETMPESKNTHQHLTPK